MSDDFGDDDFLVDDSFLREVDHIEATAVSSKPGHGANGFFKAASGKGWTGPQINPASSSGPVARQRPSTSIRARTLAPPSDDYDDIPFPDEDLMSFDDRSAGNRSHAMHSASRPAGSGNVIPSSRLGMKRTTSSSANNPLFQGHLNFRKLDQTTKGKTWDRTRFAESGRRIDLEKAKKKGKYQARTWAREDDDEEIDDLENEDDDEPLVPGPVPLVYTSAFFSWARHNIDSKLSSSPQMHRMPLLDIHPIPQP